MRPWAAARVGEVVRIGHAAARLFVRLGHLERKAHLAALHDTLAGIEGARLVLAKATDRLVGDGNPPGAPSGE